MSEQPYQTHVVPGSGMTLVVKEKGGLVAWTNGVFIAERIAQALNEHSSAPKTKGAHEVLDRIYVIDTRTYDGSDESLLCAVKNKTLATRIANVLNYVEAQATS